MRGNGLEATSYVAIADLDPRVADAMLEVFREAGLAAYVEPCQPAASLQLEVRLPTAPTDRLFVDEDELDRAKRLLDEQLPELGEPDESAEEPDDERTEPAEPVEANTVAPKSDDAAWDEIVQAYESTSDSPVPPWPVAEDTDDAADADTKSDKSDDGEPAESDDTGKAEASKRPAEPEGYVPPPPPPLPRLDPIAKGAWAALLGGPAMLIVYAIAGAYVPSWFVPVGLAAFAIGFLTLVFRMRGGPPDETDDGAVV